jgi:transposase-like protein
VLPVPLVPDGRTIRQDLSGPNRTPDTAIFIPVTNAVESLHRSLRKIIKTRGSFPTDEAALKLLFLAIRKRQG